MLDVEPRMLYMTPECWDKLDTYADEHGTTASVAAEELLNEIIPEKEEA